MNKSSAEGWGGARQNAGRKPDAVEKRSIQIRLTVDQHEKLKRLGGSKWIAEKIEQENPKFGISLDNGRDVP